MEKASVSVIIPCFNCEKTILRALSSVQRQTLPVSEVICIDDCSSDSTLKVIESFKKENSNINIIILQTEKNSGPSDARNMGWNIASGDYITFLDADNAWHPEKIRLQYLWMLANLDVSFSGHASPLTGEIQVSQSNYVHSSVEHTLVTRSSLLQSNHFETSSVMLKRNLPYRFKPGKRFCEDYLLWLQICLDGHKLHRLEICTTYVFQTPRSLSTKLLKMRIGDISNYWQLWEEKRINFIVMCQRIILSVLKFVLRLALPKFHLFLRRSSITASTTSK